MCPYSQLECILLLIINILNASVNVTKTHIPPKTHIHPTTSINHKPGVKNCSPKDHVFIVIFPVVPGFWAPRATWEGWSMGRVRISAGYTAVASTC